MLATVFAIGLVAVPEGVGADNGPLPEPCKTHPTKVVNPGCAPALVDAVTGYDITYPDLVPNSPNIEVIRWAIGWDFETDTPIYGPPELSFDTHAQNLGSVPFDLLTDDLTNAPNESTTVSQCVAWTTDYICRERRQVGGFTWHDEHKHFHFNDFADYQLRRVLADGTPDYSAAGLVKHSEKVSFCLYDIDPVSEDAFPVRRYTQCDNKNQGISPGWADNYERSIPGQNFPMEGIANGRYVLIIDLDTANHVFESNEDNNTVEVTIDVSTSPDSVVIISRRYP